MKPAASGAADPPSSAAPTSSADTKAGRRRQHRVATEGATEQTPRPGRRTSSLTTGRKKNTGVKEVELRSRGVGAVHPDGAEAESLRPNRADASEDPTHSTSTSARRLNLRLPCSQQRPLPSSSSTVRVKEKRPELEKGTQRGRGGDSPGCGSGLGLVLWRGRCLQAELIHFHLQKRLKKSGARMQTRVENISPEEAAEGELEPAAEATEAGTVTQPEQAFQDEMERLLEENEDLKV